MKPVWIVRYIFFRCLTSLTIYNFSRSARATLYEQSITDNSNKMIQNWPTSPKQTFSDRSLTETHSSNGRLKGLSRPGPIKTRY